MKPLYLSLSFFLLILTACESTDHLSAKQGRLTGEYISRRSGEELFTPQPPLPAPIPRYPWTVSNQGPPAITKDYFRCKGSALSPPKTFLKDERTEYVFDCCGSERHSLPIKDQKETIYPILLELLNYLQQKTGQRVVITSGHRCPDHNTYVDSSKSNQSSKHLIGAEVSFYVQGWEERPEKIVELLQDYYRKDQPKEYTEFTRGEAASAGILTPPWMNKEIYIKLFQRHEGRNYDNRHLYPYLSVQVRFDRQKNERVLYNWDKAQKGYLRY